MLSAVMLNVVILNVVILVFWRPINRMNDIQQSDAHQNDAGQNRVFCMLICLECNILT